MSKKLLRKMLGSLTSKPVRVDTVDSIVRSSLYGDLIANGETKEYPIRGNLVNGILKVAFYKDDKPVQFGNGELTILGQYRDCPTEGIATLDLGTESMVQLKGMYSKLIISARKLDVDYVMIYVQQSNNVIAVSGGEGGGIEEINSTTLDIKKNGNTRIINAYVNDFTRPSIYVLDAKDFQVNDDGKIELKGGLTQVQSDWNETDDKKLSYIKNKPTIVSQIGIGAETVTGGVKFAGDAVKYDKVTKTFTFTQGSSGSGATSVKLSSYSLVEAKESTYDSGTQQITVYFELGDSVSTNDFIQSGTWLSAETWGAIGDYLLVENNIVTPLVDVSKDTFTWDEKTKKHIRKKVGNGDVIGLKDPTGQDNPTGSLTAILNKLHEEASQGGKAVSLYQDVSSMKGIGIQAGAVNWKSKGATSLVLNGFYFGDSVEVSTPIVFQNNLVAGAKVKLKMTGSLASCSDSNITLSKGVINLYYINPTDFSLQLVKQIQLADIVVANRSIKQVALIDETVSATNPASMYIATLSGLTGAGSVDDKTIAFVDKIAIQYEVV